MRTIETTATVTEDGKLIITAPHDLSIGEHRVVVMIDERPWRKATSNKGRFPFQRPAYDAGLTDDSFTFRREDLYDD